MNKCFSGTLYKENLKRFWMLSALGVVLFYLFGLFSLALRDDRIYNYYDVRSLLFNQNIGFVFLECALPVAIVSALFSYLNKANSVNLIHALPYSRRELYITNYLSGVTLFAIPEIITAILLVVYKKPTYYGQDFMNYGDIDPATAVDIYTIPNILYWLAIAFVISLFVLSVCTIGAMVCGNGVIAFLTGCAFNVLVPVVLLLCAGYAATYYFGFSDSNILEHMLQSYHPAISLSIEASPVKMVLFLAISIVVAVAGYILYMNRKLERCTDSYVYTWAKHLIGFLFVFICSIVVGMILFDGMGITAYIIGGLIGFIIGQMISRKTFRIFDINGLKNLVIYTLSMLVIIGLIRLDITGYQKRVPRYDNVENVMVGGYYVDPTRSWANITFDEEENIKEAIALHQDIVDNMKELKNQACNLNGEYVEAHNWVNIIYTLKNGKELSRSYYILDKFVSENEHMNKLRKSDEAIERVENVTKLDAKDLNISLELHDKFLNIPEIYTYNTFEIVDGPKDLNKNVEIDEEIYETGSFILYGKEEFWNAYCTDLLNRYQDPDIDAVSFAYVYVNFQKDFATSREAGNFANSLYDGAGFHEETTGKYYFYLNLPVYSDMKNTVNILSEQFSDINFTENR